MTEQQRMEWHLDRRVTLGLFLAILIQSGSALWWAATFQANTQARLSTLEDRLSNSIDSRERIARLETTVTDMKDVLRSVDDKLGRLIEKQ